MTRFALEVALWCLAAGVLVLGFLLVRQTHVTNLLRRRVSNLEASVRARDEEAAHLAEKRIPALADPQMSPDQRVPGLHDERLTGTAYAQSLQATLDGFAQTQMRARSRADAAARSTLRAVTEALQDLANEQQRSISEMQERHDDPDVLEGLLELDHLNSQFGRKAQGVRVLCGAWPGRQRDDTLMLDVLRGATSRIQDYRRVEINADEPVALLGRAVEPVILTVAELLDNAVRHSEPKTRVLVNTMPAHHGLSVMIDDAGVGLTRRDVQRAENLLVRQRQVDINTLGVPPKLGFAVIGALAKRYGFQVSVDTRSPSGGTRAVVFLPNGLLTPLNEQHPPTPHPRVPEPEEEHAQGSWAPSPLPPRPEPATPAHGLPSGSDVATHPAPGAEPAPEPAPERTPAPGARPPAPRDSGSAALPLPPQAPAAPEPEPEAAPRERTTGGLPRRRRRALNPEYAQAAEQQRSQTASPRRSDPSVMGAFQRGTRAGRAAQSFEDPQGSQS
ncbi:ATP-binding protein [Streptomyces sp. NPDC005438]|uniref:sensor histidine kinase n=1 Tax=Streptomyces sp. NPDC005438 TaxID=3156880 RepID=UPI00339E5F83